MENNNQFDNNPKEEIKISKKTLYIIIAIAVALLITGVLIFTNKKEDKNSVKLSVSATDSSALQKPDSLLLQQDSAALVKLKVNEYNEEGEDAPYSDYRIIASSVPLPNSKLNFGDKVYVNDALSTEQKKVIYLKNPMENPNIEAYTIDANSVIYDYRFDDYKSNFSLAPFSGLAGAVKKILLDANYSGGNRYNITQNAERAKSSVAFGDFDGDNVQDVAVIMDNNEKQISRLLIICTNTATKQPYIAFAENYSDKLKINSFKKGASIFMNSEEFSAAPQDGIIGKAEDIKLAVVYDKDLQKFKTYYQE